MMKGMFKRALAGVAAAALAVTGFALGAGAANAEPTESITIQNAQAGNAYKAYRFAEFANIQGSNGDITSVDVNTVANPETVKAAVLNAANAAIEPAKVQDPYTTNPAALVATFNPEQLRKFADALDDKTTSLAVSGTYSYDTETATATISELEPGWYLVTDSEGKTMVVTSTIDSYKTMTINNVKDNLGEIVAKSNTPTKPGKIVEGENKVYGVGDTLDFTVTTTVSNLAGLDVSSFSHVMKDTPSTGLTITENSVKVYVADKDVASTITVEGAKVKAKEITTDLGQNAISGFTSGSLVGDDNASFTVNLTEWMKQNQAYAGATVYVQYQGMINSAIKASGKVSNTAHINNVEGDPVDVKTGKVEFLKYGVDNDENGLAGATFNVWKGEQAGTSENALKFSQTTANTDGAYVLDAAGTADVKSGANGKVVLNGLAAGKYVIKETSTNTDSGYANNFLPTFVVEVGSDGEATLVKADIPGLVTADDSTKKDIKVKNIKSITQLPLTGAAGTALFTVLGLLIAGAGALVYMKSRNVKHALRG